MQKKRKGTGARSINKIFQDRLGAIPKKIFLDLSNQRRFVMLRNEKKPLEINGNVKGKWMTTKEAASYLKISPNALRIIVHRGKINAYHLGRRLRFNSQDIESLIK